MAVAALFFHLLLVMTWIVGPLLFRCARLVFKLFRWCYRLWLRRRAAPTRLRPKYRNEDRLQQTVIRTRRPRGIRPALRHWRR